MCDPTHVTQRGTSPGSFGTQADLLRGGVGTLGDWPEPGALGGHPGGLPPTPGCCNATSGLSWQRSRSTLEPVAPCCFCARINHCSPSPAWLGGSLIGAGEGGSILPAARPALSSGTASWSLPGRAGWAAAGAGLWQGRRCFASQGHRRGGG